MSEKAEALWTVDKIRVETGEVAKRYLFRTRVAARQFREGKSSTVYRYGPPIRAQWGPES